MDDVNALLLGTTNPIANIFAVWCSGTEEDHVDGGWQHDDDFFPDNATLIVIDVVGFIKDDALYITNDISSTVQHASKNLCGHNQTRGRRIDCVITGDETDIIEFQLEITVLLIGQGLDGRGVDTLCTVLSRQGNGVLCNHCFTGRGVCADVDEFMLMNMIDGTFLEVIQFKGILKGHVRNQLIEVTDIGVVFDAELLVLLCLL